MASSENVSDVDQPGEAAAPNANDGEKRKLGPRPPTISGQGSPWPAALVVAGDLVVVREIDFEKDGNFLQTKAFEAKEDAALGSSFGLVIEGGALQYALDTKNIRDFMTLCDACSGGVVCCRVSPIQKASVAEAMKKHRSQVVLGIGDGANDVGLIKVRFLFCFPLSSTEPAE